jgi:predicted ATP-dependent endonuclease of OLD family
MSLIKGVLGNDRLSYNSSDIPVSKATVWLNHIFPALIKCFTSEGNEDERINRLMGEITADGLLKQEFFIEPCEVKLEIDYNPAKDDIREFADYIMDFDENVHSFYFIYTFSFSNTHFVKLLKKQYDKIYKRVISYIEKENQNKATVLKDMMLRLYSDCLTETCYFADAKYENPCKMDIIDFKNLYNFENINAARQLDDTDTDSSKGLSKSVISLASQDKAWKETTEQLPDNILVNIENSGVNETVQENSVKALNSVLQSITQTNGGKIGEIKIEMDIKEEDVSDLIRRITCAKYHLDEHVLNESSQGLGYSNMIYLLMKLEEFEKKVNIYKVNVFFIEEPESHMHPQMQNVFIKCLLSKYGSSQIQGLVTTHSNEMVRVVGLDYLRVIRQTGLLKSEIFDLSRFKKALTVEAGEIIKLKKDIVLQLEHKELAELEAAVTRIGEEKSILENFFDWFFEIGYSEIVFADKAILYEGDSERLYLRKLVTLPSYRKLRQQYMAFIQVGGAYAYNYMALIEFLKIKTLIITNLDYKKTALTKDDILLSYSTNVTINNFYKDSVYVKDGGADEKIKYSIDDPNIGMLYIWKKMNQNIINDNLIYLAFQDEDYLARTLEEAMISKIIPVSVYEKMVRSDWKKLKNKFNLKFTLPNNKKNEADSLFSLRDIVDNMSKSKTDFMYSVILNSHEETMLPQYIKEGLEWLMET